MHSDGRPPQKAGEDTDLPLEIHGEVRARRRPGRWIWFVPLFLLVMFLGGVLGLYFQPPTMRALFAATGLTPGAGSNTPFAVPPDVELPEEVEATLQMSDVVALARLLPRGDVTTVAPPFGAGDARIAEVLVDVGDEATAGERLAVLDNLADLESAVSTAEAEVARREANLAQVRQSIALSTDEARATLQEAIAAEQVAREQLRRTSSLFERGVATQATLDEAQGSATQTEQAVVRAQATLARYGNVPLEEQTDVIVATRNLEAARIELERAKRDLQRAYVTAPVSGTILSVDARPGESTSGGLMQIGAIATMMAEAEVYQDRVREVQPGQPVEIIAEALGEILSGRVERVGLQVERQEIVSSDTAANTDARVVEVLIALDEASSRSARGFTNLEVVARIDTRPAEEKNE